MDEKHKPYVIIFIRRSHLILFTFKNKIVNFTIFLLLAYRGILSINRITNIKLAIYISFHYRVCLSSHLSFSVSHHTTDPKQKCGAQTGIEVRKVSANKKLTRATQHTLCNGANKEKKTANCETHVGQTFKVAVWLLAGESVRYTFFSLNLVVHIVYIHAAFKNAFNDHLTKVSAHTFFFVVASKFGQSIFRQYKKIYQIQKIENELDVKLQ